jgi:hypothetical protein
MTEQFRNIEIEGKKYPTVIMGEDKFTGWFGKDIFSSEPDRAKAYRTTIQAAYDKGVRGFSMSPHETLISILKEFKKEHPDIICIANPHWKSHYYIGEESLWLPDNLKRLRASIAKRHPELAAHEWFRDLTGAFSDKEIAEIRLDVEEHKERLKRFSFCDFCLVGNLGPGALILLDRQDIINEEITHVRDAGMVPIGMCEATITIPEMEKLDIAATWTWINRDFSCPDTTTALKIIEEAKKTITAYRVLSSPKGFDLEGSIRFIKDIKNIQSMVIGVQNPAQASETFTKIKEVLFF